MKRWAYLRSAVSAQLLVSFSRERGLPESDCLRGTTIGAAAELSEPGAEIASWQELKIVRNIVGRLGDEPALGVRVGLRYHLATYDALAHAAATAATGRSAIELALGLRALCFGFCRQWLQPGASRSVVIMDDSCVPADVARFVLERDIAAWVVMTRQVIPDLRVLRRIEFAFPNSGHRSVYRKLLESDVTFAGDSHAVTMDSRLLARPLTQANPALHRRYERECLALIERRAAGSGVTGQVRGLLGDAARFRNGRAGAADQGTYAAQAAQRGGHLVSRAGRRSEGRARRGAVANEPALGRPDRAAVRVLAGGAVRAGVQAA